MVRKIDILSCTLHYKPLGGHLRLASTYVFGGCDDWLRETRREGYKNIILKTQPTCGRTANVMRGKAYEAAAFHGHFGKLHVEVCSTLKLQPLAENIL